MNTIFDDEADELREHVRVMEIALTLACDKIAELTPQPEFSSFGHWYGEAEKRIRPRVYKK